MGMRAEYLVCGGRADLEAVGEHAFQDDHHGHLVVQTERGVDAAESAGWNATVHVVGADGADIDRDTVSGRHSGRGTAAVVLTGGARKRFQTTVGSSYVGVQDTGISFDLEMGQIREGVLRDV
jgi:hypothetical protein